MSGSANLGPPKCPILPSEMINNRRRAQYHIPPYFSVHRKTIPKNTPVRFRAKFHLSRISVDVSFDSEQDCGSESSSAPRASIRSNRASKPLT